MFILQGCDAILFQIRGRSMSFYGRFAALLAAYGMGSASLRSQGVRTEGPGNTKAVASNGPSIEFATPVFDFGQIKQGEMVRHNFTFKNNGSGVLEILSVTPGCGCTTTGEWDRRVESGRSGVIQLELNSAGFSGPVDKSITVTCNDPRTPTITLQMKGSIWTPFLVTPNVAVFTVSSDYQTTETKTVRIVNQTEGPVTFSAVDGGTSTLKAELVTTKAGREFELRITAVPPFIKSEEAAYLTLKSAPPEAHAVNVIAQLIVQAPVVVAPDRVTLPAAPLAVTTNYVFMVRNNAKAPLVLSDPRINALGCAVTIQEIQPSKIFQVNVKIPAGFAIVPGQLVDVSIKSNHPSYPTIRVPVVWGPSPANGPAPKLTK
jgi:hypothetical protein